MELNSPDRRMMRRFDMRLPAVVRVEGADEVRTETQNVSARGVFFYLDRAVSAGTKLEVTLTFPPHITLTDAVRVRFTARVIRVENPLPSARIGTAAMIEDYEFLRSNGSPDFLSVLQKEWKTSN
jgi:PilZ domain